MSINQQTGNNNINPASKAIAITPANTDLAFPTRMVTLNAGGVLVFMGGDNVTYTTAALPAGSYPICAKRILPASTATGITGWA